MNLLIDRLPTSVEIFGQMVEINTDFRTGILFEEALQDPELDDLGKLQTSLDLYFPGVVFEGDAIDEAISRLIWFYRCGDDSPRRSGSAEDGSSDDPAFSYEYDADFIYAAFMQAYDIDLAQTSLHWWQFRALFRSLPEEVQFTKIIGYRTMKLPAKMAKEQRQHYERLKRIYALPLSESRQQLESDLNTLLMKGGNPSALIQ